MRARTLLLLLLAIVIAGGTAFLARSWLAEQRAREVTRVMPAMPPKPAQSVLVARADIKRGQILRAEDMVWQVWPDGALDKNYVLMNGPRKPESFAGWVAKEPMSGGEPVTMARVIAPGDRGFLAAVLHPGMRAISVPVTVTSGISGFIFPGDRVDLLLFYPVPSKVTSVTNRSPADNYEHKAVETVLHNVRVIAIDQRLQSKEGEAVVAHTATFEVSPKEGEVIALATEIGKLSLVLRSLVPDPAEATPPEPGDATAAMPQSNTAVAQAGAAGTQSFTMVANRGNGSTAMPMTAQNTTTNTTAVPSDSAVTPAPSGGPRVVTPSSPADAALAARNATYTTDNEISGLLPPMQGDNEDTKVAKFWLCKRGGAKDLDCTHPEPQGRAVVANPTVVRTPAQ